MRMLFECVSTKELERGYGLAITNIYKSPIAAAAPATEDALAPKRHTSGEVRVKMIVRIIAIAALGYGGAVLAQTSTHPYVQNVAKSTKDACTQNPDGCANARTRARQGVANAKTACLDNPAGCQQVQDKAKETAENTKARCEADPTSCQAAKTGALNRQQSRINRRGGN